MSTGTQIAPTPILPVAPRISGRRRLHKLGWNVLGVIVRLSPAEEMIWSKAFIMERERYDGADISHLIRACQGRLDWQRVSDAGH